MNPYLLTSNRITKLLQQYNEHNSLVIGVDFDFTIYDPITHTIHTDLINLLLDAQQLNCVLCLWTANITRLPFILDICKQANLTFEYINESPIHIEHEVIKPHFNILLDDTAGLGQAVDILEQTINLIRNQS